MAYQLTFSPPAQTQQGLEISSVYAVVRSYGYERPQLAFSYVVDYYASPAAKAAGRAPLALLDVPTSFSILKPLENDEPLAPQYEGISPAEANAAGGLTLAYQHLAERLPAVVPGLTLAAV